MHLRSTLCSRVFYAFTFVVLICPALQAAGAETEYPPYPNFTLERITRFYEEFARLTKDFEPGDIVVFDLDNTVFREIQMLGTDEWYAERVHQLKIAGLGDLERERVLGPFNTILKSKTRMKLMEEELPSLIVDLQSRGVTVIGLTARNPALRNSTIQHLKEFGIDFSKTGMPEHTLRQMKIPGLVKPLGYAGGIAFTSGATKGIVLAYMLERLKLRPRKLAAIDDRIHHIESFVEVLQAFEIEGVLIHYLKSLEEDPYNPEIAALQERVFKKLGLIISDEQASEFLRSSAHDWNNQNNWDCSRLLKRKER